MVAELKNKLGFSEGVLNGLTVPCAIVDPDNNILWVNQEMCDLTENSRGPEQAKGVHAGDYFFNDSRKDTMSHAL